MLSLKQPQQRTIEGITNDWRLEMNRKNTTILAAVTALLLAGSTAFAQEPENSDAINDANHGHRGDSDKRMPHRGQREGMRPEQMIEMMTRRLDLDETQTEQVKNIVSAAKPEFDALREKGVANREAMRNLDVDDAEYGVKLQNLSAESGNVMASSSELRGRLRAEIHAILTPEQREELKAAPERRQNHARRNHREDRPGPEAQ